VHGQRMEYPKPRYRDPIMVDPANYEWVAVDGMARVAHKPLGTFTERQCAAALIKLGRAATYHAGPRSVYLVLSGMGVADDRDYRRYSAFHLDEGETAEIAAEDETEMLRLVLPDLAGVRMPRAVQIEAAE